MRLRKGEGVEGNGSQKEEIEKRLEEDTKSKKPKHKVMFLCNHNSCREMAEGWLRHLQGRIGGVASAGIGGTRIREGAKL